MKKYVIELPGSEPDPSAEEGAKIIEKFSRFLSSPTEAVALLPPGWTVQIFDTEDSVTPDVEVLAAPPS